MKFEDVGLILKLTGSRIDMYLELKGYILKVEKKKID